MKKYIKKILLAVISILFLALIIIENPLRNNIYDWLAQKTEKFHALPKRKEYWMNIFVHGSFGSLLGFLSLTDVIKDNVEGTQYKKLTKGMRKNPHFYQNQPMLEKGLVQIEPTFDLNQTKGNKLLAYPIIKSYQTISDQTMPKHQVNHFYTYGWSGLLSLQRRQKESVRFFNELNEKIKEYQAKGINPKIRILAHSHGGNLVLNVAAINKILNMNPEQISNEQKLSEDENENETLVKIFAHLQKLAKSKQEVKSTKGQKIWDYYPAQYPLIIDELVFYGTPIQPETEPFYFDKTFKKTYFFYSKEDHVQKADWVSSKRLYSDQRFTYKEKFKNNPQVIQAKLMIGREIENNKIKKIPDDKEEQPTENKNFLQRIFSNKKIFKQGMDPLHKDLWFVCWQQDTKKKEDLFGPLPVAVFTPIFIKAIENLDINDVDINIDKLKNNYVISVIKHDDEKIQNQINFDDQSIKEIIPKFVLWQTPEDTKQKEFSIITNLLN
ncbi:MAG: hypothetical protein ABIA74_04355 [bacterium]